MTQFVRTQWTLVSAVAAAAVMLSACGKDHDDATSKSADATTGAGAPVATVNGMPISHDEYDLFLKSALRGRPPTDLTEEQKKQVIDQLALTHLLAAQAEKDGTDKSSEVVTQIKMMRMQMLAEGEVQKYIKGITPTDQELRAEWEADLPPGSQSEKTEYHAHHILVATKDKALAEQLIKKLKGGANFDELSKANSIDPGAKQNGGDLGWFTPSRMVKPFSDAVVGMKKGEISPTPVQTQYGWHVIKLDDTRDATPPTFEQADKKQLTNAVLQKKLQAYLEGLKKDAKIERTDKPAAADAPASAPTGAEKASAADQPATEKKN